MCGRSRPTVVIGPAPRPEKSLRLFFTFSVSLGEGQRTGRKHMKTHTVEWKHLEKNGRTCDRCHDTGANLRAVVRKLNTSLRSRRVRFRLKETLLKPTRLAESNSIIIDGQPLETLLPAARVTTTECGSCAELLGQPTDCRALTKDGKTHETIPAELLHDALRKVAEAKPESRNGFRKGKGESS